MTYIRTSVKANIAIFGDQESQPPLDSIQATDQDTGGM